jgi:hypothetical protein
MGPTKVRTCKGFNIRAQESTAVAGGLDRGISWGTQARDPPVPFCPHHHPQSHNRARLSLVCFSLVYIKQFTSLFSCCFFPLLEDLIPHSSKKGCQGCLNENVLELAQRVRGQRHTHSGGLGTCSVQCSWRTAGEGGGHEGLWWVCGLS